jgi:hypothetical protein
VNRAVSLIISLFVLILASCGGGSSGKTSSSSNDSNAVDSSRNALLNGSYAFAVADKGCACRFAAAGSLRADGAGNITSGVLDVNGDSVQAAVPITGKYNVGHDGRGTATLNAGSASYQFRFVAVSSKRVFVIGFDTHQNASGTMDLEDASAFSNSALAGNFVFHLSGIDGFGEAVEIAGLYVSDASGNITSGVADLHDNQDIETQLQLQAGSTLAVGSSNNRGTAKIVTPAATVNLASYVVDASHLKLIATDQLACALTGGCNPAPVVIGDAYRQGAAAVSGTYGFTLYGWTEGQPLPVAAGGVFSADGSGNITTGTEDVNNNGSVTKNGAVTGSYAVSSNGRGTATLTSAAGSFVFAIYPWANGVEMIEIDPNAVVGGSAFPQHDAPFSPASLKGSYAYSATGFSGNNSDALAAFSADGNGNLTGTMDLNSVGSPQSGLALTGTYALSANSGMATFKTSATSATVGLYPVSKSRVLTLNLDGNAVMTGSFELQQ